MQGRENNNLLACAIAARIEYDHAWYIIDFVIIHFYLDLNILILERFNLTKQLKLNNL